MQQHADMHFVVIILWYWEKYMNAWKYETYILNLNPKTIVIRKSDSLLNHICQWQVYLRCLYSSWLHQVKVLHVSLVTLYTWIALTTFLINWQADRSLAECISFHRDNPRQIAQISEVTSQSQQKLTSLIVCQAKRYSSWSWLAMPALYLMVHRH